jgi:hypothetical protein
LIIDLTGMLYHLCFVIRGIHGLFSIRPRKPLISVAFDKKRGPHTYELITGPKMHELIIFVRGSTV